MGKIDPESVIDSVECDLDDINDDAINITADDDQLLTEDVSPLSRISTYLKHLKNNLIQLSGRFTGLYLTF